MTRLGRNYWRFGWILLTNGAVVCLFLGGLVRQRHDQLLLYQAMRTAPPAFSYIHEFFFYPSTAVTVFTLLAGLLAEMRRSVLSPILNAGPYIVWFVALSWDAVSPAEVSAFAILVLAIIPLAVIISIDLLFYVPALRRLRTQRTDATSHS